MPASKELFDDPLELSVVEERLAETPIPDVPAYDSPHVAVMAGEQHMSNPSVSMHNWNAPIEDVAPDLRDKRVVTDPMERILEVCGKYPPLEDTVITSLIAKYQTSGDLDAKERVVLHNSRLVMHFAKEYYGRAPKTYVCMEDLFQQGMIGLQRAVEKTDLGIKQETNAKFSTYASIWIQKHMQRYTDERLGTMRLPPEVGMKLVHIRAALLRLERELGKKPTAVDIARTMPEYPIVPAEVRDEQAHEDPFDRAYSETRTKKAKMRHEQAKAKVVASVKDRIALSEQIRPVYMSRLVTTDAKAFHDTDESNDPVVHSQELERKETIREALEHISFRERSIIALRYGLDGKGERTREEIGTIYDITRSRISQIEGQSLKALGSLANSMSLKNLADTSNIDYAPVTKKTELERYNQAAVLHSYHRRTAPKTARQHTEAKRHEQAVARLAKLRRVKLSGVNLQLTQDTSSNITRHQRSMQVASN